MGWKIYCFSKSCKQLEGSNDPPLLGGIWLSWSLRLLVCPETIKIKKKVIPVHQKLWPNFYITEWLNISRNQFHNFSVVPMPFLPRYEILMGLYISVPNVNITYETILLLSTWSTTKEQFGPESANVNHRVPVSESKLFEASWYDLWISHLWSHS